MEHRVDAWLVIAVVGVLAASIATLNAQAQVVGGQLVLRQLLWGAGGLTVLLILSRLHLTLYERLAPVVYGLGLVALLAVLLWGEVRGGTRGWFAVGPLTVQPSEFARIGVMLMVAAWLSRRSKRQLSIGDCLVVGLIVGVPFVLILAEPDLGVALTYLPLLGCALWLGGLSTRAWLVMVLICGVTATAAWHVVLRPYQKERVLTIVNPGKDPYGAGYQVRQSKIAVGSGGVIGYGLGRGSQALLRFLPAQHTDFIFAAWAEATGFVGTTVLLLLYCLLLLRIAAAGIATEIRHGLCLAMLILTWLAFQVIVNLGVVLGWLPTTGITLPLFSYGGSSLLTTCAALGIVQSIWRHRLVNQ
jgi:rod shape determining protein RodA